MTTTMQQTAVFYATTLAPNLMDTLIVAHDEWVPMTDERRTQLVEELVAWSADPDAADWDYIRANH